MLITKQAFIVSNSIYQVKSNFVYYTTH